MLSIRLGGAEQFRLVKDFLSQAGYSEQSLCKRLGLGGLHEYLARTENHSTAQAVEVSDVLDGLIAVFLARSSVAYDGLGEFIPGVVRDSMEALGILSADAANPELCYSPVVLYPIQDLYIISDRWQNPDGSPIPTVHDYVFPAIHPLTHDFIEALPQSPCDRFLELCSGTAIAALLASAHYARQSWAVDITERATLFGEFNRLLNGLSNVAVMQGDLYAPVSGMRFDRIVAHPPYVPALEPRAVYADGGEDGEFITRAIVQGLPRFLEPQGLFYCHTMGVERDGEPFEQRVRQWLGAEESAFDVLFIVERTQGPTQFAYRATRNRKGNWEQMDRWRAHLDRLKIKNLAYGKLIIQAKERAGNAFTVRRQKGEHSGAAEGEWLRGWETMLASPSGVGLLLQSRPLVSPDLELHVVHSMRKGQLAPSKFRLRTAYPFEVDNECPPWVATLVARCDGKTTAREHFEAGQRDNWIRSDMTIEEFAQTLAGLVSGGMVEIEGFLTPRSPSRHSKPIPALEG
jgi:methylase of polypeptide subunit release factors